MPTIKIEPIEMATIGGSKVTITGVITNSTDCLEGDLENFNSKKRWDLNGICRDADGSCNLDTRTNEFIELKEMAEVYPGTKM